MKYKGIELKEFTSDKPVVFDPPRKMLVWDAVDREPCVRTVLAFIPRQNNKKVIAWSDDYLSCAEIPEEPKPRRATNLELAKWLAQGNGLCKHRIGVSVWTYEGIAEETLEDECNPDWRIRKWDDSDWHEPTADYMGLEG